MADLTEFIANSQVLLISDFEGTAPTTHFKKFKDYCTTKKVIFLGDLFDSTVTLGDTYCNGNNCTKPNNKKSGSCSADNSADGITATNYCALQTIKLLVDNPNNCRYVVGNRDLNKIKLLPFFQLENGHKWWRFTNKNNNVEWTNYTEIVDWLLAIEKPHKWLINTAEQLDLFKPFWNIDRWENNKEQRNNKKPNISIYDRFELLFGEDGAVGTMGAIITLKSIPDELIHNGLTNYEIDTMGQDYRAALVITVFMRMLDKILWTEIQEEKKVGLFGALDGYLYHYLLKALPAYYAEHDNNLFLFAHGGIMPAFVKGNGMDAFHLLNNVKWPDVLKQSSTELKSGGGVNKQLELPTSIDNFNHAYLKLIEFFFKNEFNYNKYVNIGRTNTIWQRKKTNEIMLTLLQLSAGNNNSIIKKTNYNSSYSPIQIKLGQGSNPTDQPSNQSLDDYKGKYTKIYNVYGHASLSSGYTFGKVADSINTYFINTDYSSTLFKEGISCKKYNENYLILVLDTMKHKLFLEGKIILNSTYIKQNYTEPFLEKLKNTTENTNCYFIEEASESASEAASESASEAASELEYNFDEEKNIFDNEKLYTTTPKGDPVNLCGFNGFVKINNTEYVAYSTPWGKKYGLAFLRNDNDIEVGGRSRRSRTHKKIRRKNKRRTQKKRRNKQKRSHRRTK